MKNKLNKYFRKFGFELHGVGYIEKLKNSSVDKNEWNKKRELLGENVKTIFDVGANRGETALKYMNIFPVATIHAFEPFPETCVVFNENHKNHKNVILNQVALSSKVGKAVLNVNTSVDTNSLLQSGKLGATSDGSCKTVDQLEIKTNTLDNYCKQNNIQEIDILKIDVQGFEIEVLKGTLELLTAGKIKLIYTESYFVQQYINQPLFYEIAALLLQYDFVLQDIYDPYYSAKNILWCDAMFICKKHFN
jgi:FkbM family methyltransferase